MKTDSHLPQFADLMSEYVNFISGIGKCDYIRVWLWEQSMSIKIILP